MIILGVAGIGTAGWVYYDAWSTRQMWLSSPEAAALARRELDATPIWIAEYTPQPLAVQEVVPLPTPSAVSPLVVVTPTPVMTATTDQLSLEATDFRFLDPPETGAHARLAITIENHAAAPSSRLLLGIDLSWFETYSVIGTSPGVSEDRTDENGLRTFSFPPLEGGARATYELHVTATAEGTRPPSVKVLLDNGDVVGAVDKPTTFAPVPRPGPVMSLDIPRLKLHSAVVQTTWEPPPFNVGQIKGTANITQGNTVLIGHLGGAAGNVFAHLDQLEPGDEVTAVSRGLPYQFVVSQIISGPNTDAAPMAPGDDSRLTLMTCAGIWNPLTHDYSERLWVIAEPPEQATITIAKAVATATVVAGATATAVAAEPTETPTPVPTPYTGQPSLPGGIGNTRVDLEKAFGAATGETSGKLVVFRTSGREVHVRFTPDPPRAQLVSQLFSSAIDFESAVRESRKLFPTDARPRATAPEGNQSIVVERFASPNLGLALGESDFSVVYVRDARGSITGIVLGLGDDIDALVAESRR